MRRIRMDEEKYQFINNNLIKEKNLVPHQDLREKYKCIAVPFSINVGSCLPPTVRLKPTRYNLDLKYLIASFF